MAASPELPHTNYVSIHSSESGQQWVSHSLTGEKAWLPPGQPWGLAFSGQGHAYIFRKEGGADVVHWLSGGDQGFLHQSVHEDQDGRRFVKDNTTGDTMWYSDLLCKYEAKHVHIEVKEKSFLLEIYELKIRQASATIFVNLQTLFRCFLPLETKGATVSRMLQNSLSWWRKALQQHGLDLSHLRQGSRTTGAKPSAGDPMRCFPRPACSLQALFVYFSRVLVQKGEANKKIYEFMTALLNKIMSGDCEVEWNISTAKAVTMELSGEKVFMKTFDEVMKHGDAEHRSLARHLKQVLPGEQVLGLQECCVECQCM